eukprot:15345_1
MSKVPNWSKVEMAIVNVVATALPQGSPKSQFETMFNTISDVDMLKAQCSVRSKRGIYEKVHAIHKSKQSTKASSKSKKNKRKRSPSPSSASNNGPARKKRKKHKKKKKKKNKKKEHKESTLPSPSPQFEPLMLPSPIHNPIVTNHTPSPRHNVKELSPEFQLIIVQEEDIDIRLAPSIQSMSAPRPTHTSPPTECGCRSHLSLLVMIIIVSLLFVISQGTMVTNHIEGGTISYGISGFDRDLTLLSEFIASKCVVRGVVWMDTVSFEYLQADCKVNDYIYGESALGNPGTEHNMDAHSLMDTDNKWCESLNDGINYITQQYVDVVQTEDRVKNDDVSRTKEQTDLGKDLDLVTIFNAMHGHGQSLSCDGSSLCTCSVDKTLRVFDIKKDYEHVVEEIRFSNTSYDEDEFISAINTYLKTIDDDVPNILLLNKAESFVNDILKIYGVIAPNQSIFWGAKQIENEKHWQPVLDVITSYRADLTQLFDLFRNKCEWKEYSMVTAKEDVEVQKDIFGSCIMRIMAMQCGSCIGIVWTNEG